MIGTDWLFFGNLDVAGFLEEMDSEAFPVRNIFILVPVRFALGAKGNLFLR